MESQGKVHHIWNELQRQLDEKGYKIKRGVIQDATFITTDSGHAPADTPRGDQAKTRRSRDGNWVKKGVKSEFGFKLHSLIDTDHQLIRRFDTTSVATHDNQVDLSEKGETVYRDKGYFGLKPFVSIDKTMKQAVKGRPLSMKDKRRNRANSGTRSLIERPFAMIKRVFHSGHILVTTLVRVHVKNLFSCFANNLNQLFCLKIPKPAKR